MPGLSDGGASTFNTHAPDGRIPAGHWPTSQYPFP